MLSAREEEILMARSVVELFQEASDLEEGDRAVLAGLLLESLEGEPDPEVEAAWAEEIERRLRQIDSGEVDLIPWEDVKARLFQSLDKKR